ncbi:hypothetical protein PN838_09910 [Psychrosphaera sp. G1-22]|uniref:Uncharacterized protein n=1 Tax=Psychrosphaera algicola TaxID=3023714 RepID=A0ABT5FCA1_9GAMM|nr:hypothetical protein [Psychrosphaera sp. G1-22]MDC2889031.1 hypothetical protein [Psychrosphaera sp. G1-22]
MFSHSAYDVYSLLSGHYTHVLGSTVFTLFNFRYIKKTQFSVGQRVALALEQLSGNQHQLALISITTWGIWALKLLAFVLFCIFASGLPAFDALMSIIIADLSSILPIHGFAGTGTFEGLLYWVGCKLERRLTHYYRPLFSYTFI